MYDQVKTIEVEVNSDCNLACHYCPNSKHQRLERGHMQTPLFRQLLGQLNDMQFAGRFNYHFYNEPLLSPKLPEFVALAKQALPNCLHTIYSNGTLLSKDKLHELLEAGIDKFIITKHVGVGQLDIDSYFSALSPAVQKKIIYKGHHDLILSNRGGLVKVPQKKQLPTKRPCFIPATTSVITLHGNVVGCYEDYSQRHSFGNIAEQSFKEIWNGQSYRRFRQDLKQGKRDLYSVCAQCNSTFIIP